MLWGWITWLLGIKLLLLRLVPSLTLSNLVPMVILYAGAMLYMENCSPKRAVSVDELVPVQRKFRSDHVQHVSPIKGGGKKLGAAPGQLIVERASDVDDTVPKSLSHTVKEKQKSGKGMDKDHNSCSKKNNEGPNENRGVGGKDKKQDRKHGEEVVGPSIPLVSAMKGSRKKMGAERGKFNVKWASDVYDPPKSRKEKDKDYNSCSKKNNEGQKGNQGVGGKDKKQVPKHGGEVRWDQRKMDAVDRFVHSTSDLDDFGVDGSYYCWSSSFLQESVTEFHYSVAWA